MDVSIGFVRIKTWPVVKQQIRRVISNFIGPISNRTNHVLQRKAAIIKYF